jgi:hypothetical protein
VSLAVVELVVALSWIENQPSPMPSVPVAAWSVGVVAGFGVAGSVEPEAAAASDDDAGRVCATGEAGAADEVGRATGAPMSSVTVAAFANGSFAVLLFDLAGVPSCVCESETTGMCRTIFRTPWEGTDCEPEVAWWGADGTGGIAWSLGTLSSGRPAEGTVNAGRGVVRAGSAG